MMSAALWVCFSLAVAGFIVFAVTVREAEGGEFVANVESLIGAAVCVVFTLLWLVLAAFHWLT